jgi:hypothetical protein
VKLTGWTPEQIDNVPAARCDWLLAIDDEVRKAEEEMASRG